MNSISIQLFNQNDPSEFEKFRRKESDSVLEFCSELVEDIHQSQRLRDEVFEIIFLLENKHFKNYEDLKKFLSLTANNRIFEYKQYEKLKHQ